jgi:hypothetical protein
MLCNNKQIFDRKPISFNEENDKVVHHVYLQERWMLINILVYIYKRPV